MPYKTEKLKLNSPFLDSRVKLLPCQKEMIIYWTKEGLSQRKLAIMFRVSRRLIQFIQNPQKLEENKKKLVERGGSKIYYKGGAVWNEQMKKHRIKKHNLLKHLTP